MTVTENILPRGPLLTTYKSFIRLHRDYGDFIYDQHQHYILSTFHQKLESIQHDTALAIIGAIRVSLEKTLSRIKFWNPYNNYSDLENFATSLR